MTADARRLAGSPGVRVRPAPRERGVAAGPEGGRRPPAGPALSSSRGISHGSVSRGDGAMCQQCPDPAPYLLPRAVSGPRLPWQSETLAPRWALLGRLDSRQPGVREARPVEIDNHLHEPSVLIGLEAQHIAFHHWPEALLLHNGAVPAGRDRARGRVVVEVQQVIWQAGVGAAQLGHPVILTMGLALAGQQRTE